MTTYLGKSCSFCLPRVPFVNCRQFMYLVISLLVLRAGYGIWLYQFLIIAYLFTLNTFVPYFSPIPKYLTGSRKWITVLFCSAELDVHNEILVEENPLSSWYTIFRNSKMSGEQMTLRADLRDGHSNWVTQIATNPQFPDMILSASRGSLQT